VHSQSLSVPTSALAGCKRSVSSRSHRTPSGRNRWSSYELVGAAALSATAEVDDDASDPATATVDNGPAIGRAVSAETLSAADQLCSKDTLLHKTASDPPTTINTPSKERHACQAEILGTVFHSVSFVNSLRWPRLAESVMFRSGVRLYVRPSVRVLPRVSHDEYTPRALSIFEKRQDRQTDGRTWLLLRLHLDGVL